MVHYTAILCREFWCLITPIMNFSNKIRICFLLIALNYTVLAQKIYPVELPDLLFYSSLRIDDRWAMEYSYGDCNPGFSAFEIGIPITPAELLEKELKMCYKIADSTYIFTPQDAVEYCRLINVGNICDKKTFASIVSHIYLPEKYSKYSIDKNEYVRWKDTLIKRIGYWQTIGEIMGKKVSLLLKVDKDFYSSEYDIYTQKNSFASNFHNNSDYRVLHPAGSFHFIKGCANIGIPISCDSFYKLDSIFYKKMIDTTYKFTKEDALIYCRLSNSCEPAPCFDRLAIAALGGGLPYTVSLMRLREVRVLLEIPQRRYHSYRHNVGCWDRRHAHLYPNSRYRILKEEE